MTDTTSNPPVQAHSNRLPVLAAEINHAHGEAMAAAATAIEHAIECGRRLIEARKLVGHGEWLPWIEQNLRVGPRQAQRFMRLASHADELPNASTKSHLSIEEGLALLSGQADLSAFEFLRDRLRLIDPRIRLHTIGLELPDELNPMQWALVGRILGEFPGDGWVMWAIGDWFNFGKNRTERAEAV